QQQRVHLVRLHALRRRGAAVGPPRRRRAARRHRGQRRLRARGAGEREEGGLRRDESDRGRPRALPHAAADRGGVRGAPLQQAYLGLAWHAAPTGNTDIYAVDLLTYILGDGPSSRLNQVLREQRGLVQTIEASYIPRQQSGLVSVTARLDAKHLDAAEAAVR